MISINRLAMLYYKNELLHSSSGKNALRYLKDQGLKKETIDYFNLGYASGGWCNLSNYFSIKRISLAIAEETGLIIRDRSEIYFDRFRDRIMFPFFDIEDQVIGFGGLAVKGIPRYLHSPATAVFNHNVLYGIHLLKSCKKMDTVIIVKEYINVISLWQDGIKKVSAIPKRPYSSDDSHRLLRLLKEKHE